MPASRVFAARTSAVAQPAQNFEGAKIFYFRLTPVFCLENRLSKHKMTRYSKNLRGPWPFWLPLGNAYGPVFVLLLIAFLTIKKLFFKIR